MKTQIAKADRVKSEKPEFESKYKIWARYAKHPRLRPILDRELGPKYFRQTPRNLEELIFRLKEIRAVFASANIEPAVQHSILFGASMVEKMVPEDVCDLQGFAANVQMALPELTQLTAEAECEYGSLFESGLESRMLITLGQIGYLTKRRNDELKGRTPLQPVGDTPTTCDMPQPPPPKKRKQKEKK